MDSIVQAILNLSKLEVSLIRITQATATTFIMSIESKTTNTGPLPATLSPMTVDLVGPKGVFGKLSLPEVKTTSKGADINIGDQLITIIDMNAYTAFIKSLQLDEKVTLHLDNGQGTIKALMGMKSKIVYKKAVNMNGMDGPQTQIVSTQKLADGSFKNTVKIINPSPVEIDLGKVTFGFKNAAGELLGTQTGNVFIKRGETIYEAVGTVSKKGNVSRVNLVGLETENDSWIKTSLSFFNTTVKLTPELTELFSE